MVAINRKKKDIDKPYITAHIKQLIRKKISIAIKYCKQLIKFEKKKYKRMRNYVNKIIKQAKIEYCHTKLEKE